MNIKDISRKIQKIAWICLKSDLPYGHKLSANKESRCSL